MQKPTDFFTSPELLAMCLLLGWGRIDYEQNSEMQQFLLYIYLEEQV